MAIVQNKAKNQGIGQLLVTASAGAGSITLASGQGAKFPSVFPFQILLEQYDSLSAITAREIATCTNRSGDTLSITRATEAIPNTPESVTQEQVARTFDITPGICQVSNVFTAKSLDDLYASTQEGAQKQAYTFAVATGLVNAYAVNLSPSPTSYTLGMRVQFEANLENTGSASLNVNALGAKIVKKLGGTANLVAGDIAAGSIVDVIYNGTDFEMQTPSSKIPSVDVLALTEDTVGSLTADYLLKNNGIGPNKKIKPDAYAELILGKLVTTGFANISTTSGNSTVFTATKTGYINFYIGATHQDNQNGGVATIIQYSTDGGTIYNTFRTVSNFATGGSGAITTVSWSGVFFVTVGMKIRTNVTITASGSGKGEFDYSL